MNILLATLAILGVVYCRRHHRKHHKHKTDVDYDMCVPKGDYATKADLKKIVRDLLEVKILENQADLKGPEGNPGKRGPNGKSGSCCEIYKNCRRTVRDVKLRGKRKSYVVISQATVYWHDAYLQCLQQNMTLPELRSEADYAEMTRFVKDNHIGSDAAWTGITSFEHGLFFTYVSDGEPMIVGKWSAGPYHPTPPPAVLFSTYSYKLYTQGTRESHRRFFCERWS